MFDTKLTGETITNPTTRKPPLKTRYFEDVLPAVIEARAPDGKSLAPHDVYLFLDGGKERFKRIKKIFTYLDTEGENQSAGKCQVCNCNTSYCRQGGKWAKRGMGAHDRGAVGTRSMEVWETDKKATHISQQPLRIPSACCPFQKQAEHIS